jgi:hypothetical protein
MRDVNNLPWRPSRQKPWASKIFHLKDLLGDALRWT